VGEFRRSWKDIVDIRQRRCINPCFPILEIQFSRDQFLRHHSSRSLCHRLPAAATTLLPTVLTPVPALPVFNLLACSGCQSSPFLGVSSTTCLTDARQPLWPGSRSPGSQPALFFGVNFLRRSSSGLAPGPGAQFSILPPGQGINPAPSRDLQWY